MDFTRRPISEEQKAECEASGNYWTKGPNGYHPTAEEVNAWSLGGMGHDAINMHICMESRCQREGVELSCKTCDGSGNQWTSVEAERDSEAWTPTDPPQGEGFQLWETTSEGSPISPVFETLDELCNYAATNCTVFGSNKTSATEWKKMLEDDFVCHKEGNMIFM